MIRLQITGLAGLMLLLAACACPEGTSPCGDLCVDTRVDEANCGACGATCAAGEVCSAGVCAVACPAGEVKCGGKCVDPLTDRAFCGASNACTGAESGVQCGSGQVCAAGKCAVSCQAGLVNCGGKCVDPLTDREFCGASGACASDTEKGEACDAGEVCSAGACAVSCQAGLVNCGGKCVDPLADRAFCGASNACAGAEVGTQCGSGQVCSAGKCAVSCQAGLVNCGGKCVDPLTDRAFCGASNACTGAEVGTQCGSGQVCSAGQCAVSCQAGLVNCGGKCVDPMTDRAFCGASNACTDSEVGSTCSAGEVCSAGVCAVSCQAGLVNCGGKCVDPLTDRAFCGAADSCTGAEGGTSCLAGQLCSAGRCALTCQAGLVNCGGKCVDPLTDRAFCGASNTCTGTEIGAVCLPGQVCSAGVCALSCQAGLVNCGGKCIDPLTDRAFCGASGACTGATAGAACGSAQGCSAGRCVGGEATLSGLAIMGGALSPQFSPATTTYTLAVTSVAQALTVLPTATSAGATITVNGTPVASGSRSAPIAVTPGTMALLSIRVEFGGTTVVYGVIVISGAAPARSYVKASNAEGGDIFAYGAALDGDTLVVGAPFESGGASGVGANQASNTLAYSGAAYVFVRSGAGWAQQAYLKASNPGSMDQFGTSVAISGDTLVVGAPGEGSNAVGVDGNQANNSADASGAAYVFTRTNGVWSQQAYLKASNTGANDQFGRSVAISGNTVVVGAWFEASAPNGVSTNPADNSRSQAGAAYVFTRTGGAWSQQAFLKARFGGSGATFGGSLALEGDTLAVGAMGENNTATGINSPVRDFNAASAGAVFVFTRTDGIWSEQAYVKASNTGRTDSFGVSVALSGDTLAVGARGEASAATGVGGNQADDSAGSSGAVYVFTRTGSTWRQQAYLKASNTQTGDTFGTSVDLDGDTLVVGAPTEDSALASDPADNAASSSGAAYVFSRSGGTWGQVAYLKASNVDPGDRFGSFVATAAGTVVVAAEYEDGASTGLDGNQADNTASDAGAVYVWSPRP